MKKKCIVSFVLVVCVVLAVVGTRAPDQLGPVMLLPEATKDAALVGSVDVRQIAELGALDEDTWLNSLMLEQARTSYILEQINLDVTKDIHSVAFAVTQPEITEEPVEFVVLIAGRFDGDAIYQVIGEEADKAVPATYADHKLFAIGQGDDKGLFGILDGKLAIAGTEQWVHKTIDNYDKGAEKVSPAAARLKGLEGTFKVSMSKNVLLPPGTWQQAQMFGIAKANVKTIGFCSTLKSVQPFGMDFQAKVTFDNAQSAATVGQTAGMWITDMKVTQPASRMLLDKLSLDVEGDTLTLKADIDQNMVAQAGILTGMPMPDLSRWREQAKIRACKFNLRKLGLACTNYLDTHGQSRFMPPDLKSLVDKEVVAEKGIFVCPADDLPGEGWQCSYGSIFDLTDKKLTDPLPSDMIKVWDNAPRHDAGQSVGRCVVFVDGHVEHVTEGRFQELLKIAKKFIGGE